MRAGSLTSPIAHTTSCPWCCSANSCSIVYRLYSFRSSSTSRRGANRAIWRASSAPIEPPAPVTMTTRPLSHSRRPPVSSVTGSRPSRSSSSTWRSCDTVTRPLTRSSYDGTVSTRNPACVHCSSARRRTPCVGFRHRDDRQRDAEPLAPRRDIRQAAEDVDPVQLAARLGGVVVEETHHAPLRAARKFLDEVDRRVVRPEHEDGLARVQEPLVEAELLPGAEGEPAAAHDQDEKQRAHDQHRPRHGQSQHHEGGRHRDRGHAHRRYDAAQVGQARESPDAAVEAEAPERRDVHCDHRGERLDGVLEKRFRRYLEVEAQPERGQPGDNARDDVVGESGRAAPVDSHGAALRSAATGCRRRQARPTAAMSAR